jgi:PUA domain protein
MPEKFRRYFLKAKDTKALLDEASRKLGANLEQIFKGKVNFELIQTEFAEFYLVDGKPQLAKTAGMLFPTLTSDRFLVPLPKVFVDRGAIPHVCNGANIMAPGIVRFGGEFRKGNFVLIVDEIHGKQLAIGEALYDLEEAKKIMHGIVFKNVHFVGDEIWDFLKRFEAES